MSKTKGPFDESIMLLREYACKFDGVDDSVCDDYRHALFVLENAGKAHVEKTGEGKIIYYYLDVIADQNLRKAIYEASK